jgi:pimeloyl-ACP methyl ester carboxylesterase
MKPKSLKIECAGYSVDADWYEGDNTDEILLTLIGWTSNRKKYGDITSAIVKNTGMSALVFEYSGHGDSPFNVEKTRPAQHFLEVICAYDWLRGHHPNAKISVMGASYGGYMAAKLTEYRRISKLVLRAPAIYKPIDFYSLNGSINSDEGWAAKDAYRRDTEALKEHPLLANARSFNGRTLVVVHENDKSVPKETTDAYIKAFDADAYIAEGAPHSVGDMTRDQIVAYQKAISEWLNS